LACQPIDDELARTTHREALPGPKWDVSCAGIVPGPVAIESMTNGPWREGAR
jgi:hypothetical protein